MAIAGRVLIIPRGEYNSEKNYEGLDLVFYKGNSWLCKKSTCGIEPSKENEEYWYLFSDISEVAEKVEKNEQSIASLESRVGENEDAIDTLEAQETETRAIALGKNRARVFATTDAMTAWLSDDANKGVASVGDNLYIVDTGVPDWWISEVLDAADEEGKWYKIAQMETQKVDLTTINDELANLSTRMEEAENTEADLQGQIDEANSNLTSLKDYSTEETVVGTWIDGKPIYRKCYVGTPNLSNTNEVAIYIIPSSINCNDIDTLINVSTHYRGNDSNDTIAPFTYYRRANVATTYDIDASGIRLFRNGQALYSYVVIVEYTKA